MRVLHLVKTSVGAVWALHQIRELVKLGIDVHVALPGGGPMVGKYREVGATEHLFQTDLSIRSPWEYPKMASKFLALIQRVQPNIIHSHFVGTTLFMRLVLGKENPFPRVFQVPGPLHLEHAFFRKLELATAGQSDFWIGSCQWTCDCYQKSGIACNKIFLSYYGTDVDFFTPKEPGKLRKELNLGPDFPIVGMVAFMYAPKRWLGQVRGLKGHEDIIDAFSYCLRSNPKLRCVIVGSAWKNATSYEKKVRNYGYKRCGEKIFFLGNRDDVADLYADFDIAVHPSHSENVGGAVESLLLGVPTIATKVGGIPDLVKNGVTGVLVPAKDPKSLSRAIQKMLEESDAAKKMAFVGQTIAREMFDVKRTAKEIKQIYSRIV